jgi:hypothetical protein
MSSDEKAFYEWWDTKGYIAVGRDNLRSSCRIAYMEGVAEGRKTQKATDKRHRLK